MIQRVILWSNGMVLVFDQDGKQMPELQGKRSEVVSKLKTADLSEATFDIGAWNQGTLPMTREQFFGEGWE